MDVSLSVILVLNDNILFQVNTNMVIILIEIKLNIRDFFLSALFFTTWHTFFIIGTIQTVDFNFKSINAYILIR